MDQTLEAQAEPERAPEGWARSMERVVGFSGLGSGGSAQAAVLLGQSTGKAAVTSPRQESGGSGWTDVFSE